MNNYKSSNKLSKNELRKVLGSEAAKAPKTNKFMALEDEFDDETENTQDGSFAELFEQSSKDQESNQLRSGQLVEGKVVSIGDEYIFVDIGYKSEGQCPVDQFHDEDKKVTVSIGDEVELMVERSLASGAVYLSKNKADVARAWKEISIACTSEEIIEGKVTGVVKGGLTVDIGVKAFLPSSQIDVRPVTELDPYLGETLKVRVIKFNRKRSNIVLSRRAVLEEKRSLMRDSTLKEIKEGSVVLGTVKNITDYGAFVDLGGVDGLLHITDMSWGRIKHPSEVVNVGDEVKVRVTRFDKEKERVSLGMKQVQEDPWMKVSETYPRGGRVNGKIVSITEYGAFVEIEPGVEGLIHVSEMSWSQKVKDPKKIVEPGQEVEAVILDIDTDAHRISLGLKQIQPNPWDELSELHPIGSNFKGKVKKITDFGVFVEVKDGIDGLIHVSELSWDNKASNPAELFEVGQEVEAAVLAIDKHAERFSLSIKALTEDPWKIMAKKHKQGDIVDVTVSRLTNFGAFVELEAGLEGMIHVSELTEERVPHPEAVVKVGETIKAEITNINLSDKKISLSVNAMNKREERENIDTYNAGQSGGSSSSFADTLNPELAEKLSLLASKNSLDGDKGSE